MMDFNHSCIHSNNSNNNISNNSNSSKTLNTLNKNNFLNNTQIKRNNKISNKIKIHKK